MNVRLNEDVTSIAVNVIIPDLWTRIVGVYAITTLYIDIDIDIR